MLTGSSQLKPNTAHGAKIAKPPILKIYGIQLLILLCVSAGLFVVNITVAYSALLGGLIFIGPNFYFASLAFRYQGARAAKKIAETMYRGEVIKFLLSAVLFAAVFVLVEPISAGALFVAFIGMLLLNTALVIKMGQ